MMFSRSVANALKTSLHKSEHVTILYGPRQAGKTTLIKTLLGENAEGVYFANGDDIFTQKLFSQHEWGLLQRELGNSRTIVIDEAQKIPRIGLTMKILVDKGMFRIVASGSASFDLAQKVTEPLTGRTDTFHLFPLLYSEVKDKYRGVSPPVQLEECMLYGMYPRVHQLEDNSEKERYLTEYLSTYLYKDILAFDGVRKPQKVVDLLTLLALQINNEVSIAELASTLSIGHAVVGRYLDVLEKMFIIVPLRGLSRNLRKEVGQMHKYYFVDLGVRNALLKNFNTLSLRNDVGALFENWFIMEVYKYYATHRTYTNQYFWRTYDQQEVDLVIEQKGILQGYECKWSPPSKSSPPKGWMSTYQNATYTIVHKENVHEILDHLN